MPVQRMKTTATDQGKGENKRVPNSLFLLRYPRNRVCVRERYTIMTTLKVKKSPSDVEHRERNKVYMGLPHVHLVILRSSAIERNFT